MHRSASKTQRALLLLASIAALPCIGWLDFWSGADIAFSIFYLVPILACGWWVGLRGGIGLAVLAAIVWTAADLPWRTTNQVPVTIWNGLTRLTIFTALGSLTAIVRRDNQRLAELLAAQERLARTDPLTDLPNKRAFEEALDTALARSRRDASTLVICFVDLDNFKRVNDRFGHEDGDRLLIAAAAALVRQVRDGDLVARLGGDEFALLLWRASAASLDEVGHRLVNAVREAASPWPDAEIGASVGFAVPATGPIEVRTLVREADAAMYEAKMAGKNTCRIRLLAADPASDGGSDLRRE